MCETARQFNNMYITYQKKFKKTIENVELLIEGGFTDEDFIEKFKELYQNLWDDLNKKYTYWHEKNEYMISKEKILLIMKL